MQFQKLRVSGFKSFVDATEFRIDPGLTGIVGPNGCGKSNLLEALRWVMGATSAKAMRGAGMDDIIFAGADKRPPRNWAEVTLTIDNGLRRAPHPFTDQPILEVARRIDRGAGSTYRINGKEVRARDIQLLFADASTGANSPALVRQGQISELINAKPQNRRRVLEEAGGVSGLHTRRHEAELRLRAAETNLGRLDDISRELDQALSRLKREARQADKFKKISAEIRALQRAILHARWLEEQSHAEQVTTQLREISQKADDLARAAAVAQTEALNAAEAIKPAREEEAIAATIVHRLNIEKERLDLEEKQIVGEIERLKGDLRRFMADHEREAALTQDGTVQIERLDSQIAHLETEIRAAPSREPELIAQAEALDEKRRAADQAVEQMAALQAALVERQRADDNRLAEAEARRTRARTQLEATQAEKAALGVFEQAALDHARDAVKNLTASLDQLRVDLEALEADRAQLAEAETAARQAHRQIEDDQGRLSAEAKGLAQLLNASTSQRKTPVLDQVRPEKGYELALAAALGDDLNLSVATGFEADDLAFWTEGFKGEALPPDFGTLGAVEPLSRFVVAPPTLALRLKTIGVVADKATGDKLQTKLPTGARLVSREGDLWRWDGVTVRAKAPKPAFIRLSQRTRLEELEARIKAQEPELVTLQARATEARRQVSEIDDDLKSLRPKRLELENARRAEQQKLEELQRLEARYEARSNALDDALKQRADAVAEAEAQARATRESMQAPADTQGLETDLTRARSEAEAKRHEALAARSELENERRERTARESRLNGLNREREDWKRRTFEARARLEKLETDQTQVRDLLLKAEQAPRGFEDKRLRLMDQLATAERRLNEARDALSVAETRRREAETVERSLGVEAATAREHRASALARQEAQTQRQDELTALILEQTGLDPETLGRKLKEEAIASPADSAGAIALLSGLERERDELGPVNLRAEEEATEYQTRLESISRERLDLTTAIAKLRDGIDELNTEGRERLLAAFDIINANFQRLFVSLFGGGEAELRLIESDDPLEAGLEIFACPPGKRLSSMSLMSGGEQALTATALIFGVFLANPAPVCVLDEVDAPLDDANVDRYCRLLDEMRKATHTRFITITHNPVTMARMDRLFGVTMAERGVSQLVSVELSQAEAMVAEDA